MVKDDNMTAANLRSAFAGESQAYMRYSFWGQVAHKDGFPNVATLFEAVANSEKIHAQNHFDVHKNIHGDQLVPAMGGFGSASTSENLKAAREGELWEVDQMYATFIPTAEQQEESDAKRSFHWAREVEKGHADLFLEAKHSVDENKDYQYSSVYVCGVCGHTHPKNPKEKCPVCGAPESKYKKYGN
ncbi:rubrerythrin family protein [Proteinivorax hydrogeniformans]|uniref:Rubrerythrin family protein n=1 Tax=Proteinivorax hydrogeniformans TaxID=1826727 RepID=A0AAU8HQE3_9FIRM